VPIERFPDFYLVGAPKCGSTSLYEALRRQPELFLPETKELIYFGTDLSYRSRLSKDEFLAHFVGAGDDARVGTAHTAYLQSRTAATEIRAVAPDAVIIAMVRNPIDMVHSWHSELLYEAVEDIQDFEAALDAEPDRRRGARLPKNALNYYVEALYYTDVASFAEQVLRYFNVFGRERVHVIIHDDLCRDPAGVYRRTLEFLGVESAHEPRLSMLNPNKTVRSRHLQELFFHTTGPARSLARRVIPRPVRRGLISANTRYEPRAAMSPTLRRTLQDLFAPDVAQLGDLLDRDLSHWVSAPV
jgi:hypothetical protein